MKHFYALLFTIGISVTLWGQTDTLQVSKDYKTILVLPESYSFSINGKDLNFIESFPQSNSEQASRIVMLGYNDVAPNKIDYTNYTVYTNDGLAYDFILELVAIPQNTRWNLTKSMVDNSSTSILPLKNSKTRSKKVVRNEEQSIAMDSLKNKNDKIIPLSKTLYEENRITYLEKKCENHVSNKGNIARYFEKVGDVFIWLKGVYYDREELYFLVTIENKEPIDLDINFLKSFIGTNYKQSSSNQKSEFQTLHRFGQPKRIKGNSSATFFLIFDKFTLDRNKHLVLELDERNGNRNLSLEIEHQLVNRPKKFGK
jgi:hypothetical protein